MRGIRIDRQNNPSFDLRDILAIVGEPALQSDWRCQDLWYTVKDEDSDEYVKAPRKVTGAELLRFADVVMQIIDGRFEASSAGAAKRPWLMIMAVDSSYWEVWSTKQEVLEIVRARFSDAVDLPPLE